MSDTIFAPATAAGRAAVAVIRISGPVSRETLWALAPGRLSPRRASLRALRRPSDGAVLDQALVLWLPGPASFTGEDSAELHLHGGAAVTEAVIETLLAMGLRLAEPGEFTRRAFEHGRLDLAQAEAVADLVDAETEAQRRQALGQLDGELSARHTAWREGLIDALASLEAAVDFPDEEVPEAVAEQARAPIARVAEQLADALADSSRGQRVREGFRIALIGAPNAGKSSLLNALAGSDRAIVTATPGTTRDVIEVVLNLAGYRVTVADTAGLRHSEDPIEAEGVRRAADRAVGADLRLLVVDSAAADEAWWAVVEWAKPGDLLVLNKADLPQGSSGATARAWAEEHGMETHALSLSTGAGFQAMSERLSVRVVKALAGAEFPAATRARHRRDLEAAEAHLRRALAELDGGLAVELAAEDVRLAARCLARIGGRIDAEDVLDLVFARFCIGK
ncbi:tRNA uridine-5-carboxymethylaminomethyl(34) synthesis GTPase MnmE [Phenylobacterium montanum]|uniref:tRNA modification GTPase MnmE n=1 Tax=Phenylobacterium montanum TaxID=2823693 RepID=A0A975FWW7_9CAUL|nr:tRNA uridine-5-carboxymethylaminomethyl(34) synthesis GTPase MnmE [Caulobacter sp. S6]QUD86646.1 tRNA uridine-5-carboxymethylaminomethyl(34) synthesis GTPase MnmE [Caulobacter sp. S6]